MSTRLSVVEAAAVEGRRGAWDFRLRKADGTVIDASLRHDGEAGRGTWEIPGVASGRYTSR